jgi:drug/metabolite transporter (DMT)-like permease
VEAGRASILAYTLPLWVVPIVAIAARALPSRPEVTGLLLGLAGLALLLNPVAIDWTSPQVLVGVTILLAGAVAGAAALVHVRTHRWVGTPFDVQIWELAVALAPMAILAVILEWDEWAAVDWDLGIALVVLYSGALATAFAYWGSQSIVRAIGPTTTSIAYLAVPVVGIVTGAIVLAEPITLLDLAGLVVTSAGVIVVVAAGRGTSAWVAAAADGAEAAAVADAVEAADGAEAAAVADAVEAAAVADAVEAADGASAADVADAVESADGAAAAEAEIPSSVP